MGESLSRGHRSHRRITPTPSLPDTNRKTFMLYDIINPSDCVTFRAPDLQVAALSMFLLSEGKFGADCREGDGENVPIFLMGGAMEWWDGKFDEKIDNAIVRRAGEIADALDSVVYGDWGTRPVFERELEAIEGDEAKRAFVDEWNDEHRSSMNNIRSAATGIAAQLREKYAA